jgi:AraC-type DNA-binding domain-containing proteins
MVKYNLQEAITHGDIDLPISLYKVTFDIGNCNILPPHWHNEFELIYILRGYGTFKIDNITYTAEQGSLLVINSQELHSAFCDNMDGCDYYAFVFNMTYILGDKQDVCQKKYINPLFTGKRKIINYISGDKQWEIECIEIVKNIIEATNKKKDYYELFIKVGLYEMINVMYINNAITETQQNFSKDSENIEGIKRVIEYINNNYSKEILIDELAKIANLSKYHFIRTFGSIIGISPIKYINMVRINEAASLLQSGCLNITEVSNKCGFDNVSYFIKIFKAYKRETPYNYGKIFRK